MLKNRLIIFTRYPEPGKTKTRMIPALGAKGAANLQQEMTEHTVNTANKLLEDEDTSTVVYYAGGSRELMQNWLGKNLAYQPQAEGDLGVKIMAAIASAIAAKIDKIVIIGTDCPAIDKNLLVQAFTLLDNCDLVIGPATDGGYYLIGLKHLFTELFIDISWGSSRVLAQTLAVAERLNLSVGKLDIQSDIDRPEDLNIWYQFKK